MSEGRGLQASEERGRASKEVVDDQRRGEEAVDVLMLRGVLCPLTLSVSLRLRIGC